MSNNRPSARPAAILRVDVGLTCRLNVSVARDGPHVFMPERQI